MYQVNIIPTVTKYIKASELPQDWMRVFTNPAQVVAVTVSDMGAPTIGQAPYQPTATQQASLDRGVEQIRRGEFVSDQIMSEFRRKHECL